MNCVKECAYKITKIKDFEIVDRRRKFTITLVYDCKRSNKYLSCISETKFYICKLLSVEVKLGERIRESREHESQLIKTVMMVKKRCTCKLV